MLGRASQRVHAEWETVHQASGDGLDLAPILALCTRAAEHGDASFLDEVRLRPSLRLSLYVVDRLEDAVLAQAHSGDIPAAQILEVIARLRLVRAAIERRSQQLPGAPLQGVDGLEFLVEFVHDLRAPLGALQLLADRLQQGGSGAVTALQQRQLRLIYAAAHALNNVTSNALQLTREWDQLAEPEPRPFSVTRVLSEVQEIVRTLAVQNGLEIIVIGPNVDRRLGHPIELQRILLNLVTNALKFTRAGNVTMRATDVEDARMEFVVQDTGPGIAESMRSTLFQPFQRCDGHPTFSSTRLGLAIAQRLVRALGGRLTFQTELHKGTLFSFVIPLSVP